MSIVDTPWGSPWGSPWGGYDGNHGKLRYTDLEGNEGGYVFEKNFDYGDEFGYLDLEDNSRALNGTLHSYAPEADKQKATLTFSHVPQEQFDALVEIWKLHVPVSFYQSAQQTEPTFVGKIVRAPSRKSEPYFQQDRWLLTFTLELEEI